MRTYKCCEDDTLENRGMGWTAMLASDGIFKTLDKKYNHLRFIVLKNNTGNNSVIMQFSTKSNDLWLASADVWTSDRFIKCDEQIHMEIK